MKAKKADADRIEAEKAFARLQEMAEEFKATVAAKHMELQAVQADRTERDIRWQNAHQQLLDKYVAMRAEHADAIEELLGGSNTNGSGDRSSDSNGGSSDSEYEIISVVEDDNVTVSEVAVKKRRTAFWT